MSTPFSSTATFHPPLNLNVPVTQNTAPVIKFRCLYTYDLRRKAKRWQDGYLRFHTFNKRVMAYDTTGNFIGDLHWRQDESVQDGDELELDRGVLIQVCESVEKTETDLSALYTKRTCQGSPSRSGDPCAHSFRAPTPLRSSLPPSSLPSQPSRSLNDLLGIKKTPIRPLVSSYEEKHQPCQRSDFQGISQPATKRQKTASSENRAREPSSSRSNPTQPIVIDLSDQRGIVDESRSSKVVSARVERPQQGLERTNITSNSSSASDIRSKTKTNAQTINTSHSAPGNIIKSSSRTSTNISRNTLRLSAEKPRKRLMYSALLPSEASSNTSTTVPSSENTNGSAQKNPQDVCMTAYHVPPNLEFAPSASTQFALDETAGASESHGDQNTRIQGILSTRSSAGLRKSYSDPTALTTLHGLQPRSTSSRSRLNTHLDEDTAHDQGPWTSEALDLFDFWPLGRPKPI